MWRLGLVGAAVAAMAVSAVAHGQSPATIEAAEAPAQPGVVIINPAQSGAPAPVAGAAPVPETAGSTSPATPAAAHTSPEAAQAQAEPAPGTGEVASQQADGGPPANAVMASENKPAIAADSKSEASGPAMGEANPAADAPPPPPAQPTLVVNIDLGAQRMAVYENGEAKHLWPVSSARYGYRTPTGTFKPVWMTKMWYSRQYDWSPMPYAIFFHEGTAIHGTYATRLLGQPASHGCVRLGRGNAALLFKLVTKHGKDRTKIVVHGKPNHRAPAIAEGPRYPVPRRGYAYLPGYYDYYAYAPPPYYASRPVRGRRYEMPRRYVQRGFLRSYGYSFGF